MKPFRSFLFLAGIVLVLLLADFLGRRAGYGSFLNLRTERVVLLPQGRWQGLWQGRAKAWAQEEDREILSLQEVWAQDTLMNFYRLIYRLDADIFQDEELQGIPVTPFEFDSSQTGRMLLDDFFVKLLVMRNPDYAESLRQWYSKPDFWTEALAHNRKDFVRILHFGDSQIENDRITSTLRRFFQTDFGGKGPGLLPLFASYHALQPTVSGAWHTVKAEKNSRRGNYGIYDANLTCPPLQSLVRSKKKVAGTLEYRFPENFNAPFLDVLVHEDLSASALRITEDGKPVAAEALLETFGQKRLTYPLWPGIRKLKLEVELRKNHTLYALAANDTVGVSVDNIAVRGGAGTVFTPNNRRFLVDQYMLLNTGLIIYQFGVNALKNPSAQNHDYGYFRMLLLQELTYIRAQMPDVPVIVVGVADKPQGGLRAGQISDVEQIRQIQKEVAFQTGCIYWDLCEAMGGKNSMKRWADASPALVSSDYVHFTEQGAEVVGTLFYKAFLNQYRDFLLRERKSQMLLRAKQLQGE